MIKFLFVLLFFLGHQSFAQDDVVAFSYGGPRSYFSMTTKRVQEYGQPLVRFGHDELDHGEEYFNKVKAALATAKSVYVMSRPMSKGMQEHFMENIGEELVDFVKSGGTLVAGYADELLDVMGLMSPLLPSYENYNSDNFKLDKSHPITRGVPDQFRAPACRTEERDPEATILLAKGNGDPILMIKKVGLGYVIYDGFIYKFDDAPIQVLVKSLNYWGE